MFEIITYFASYIFSISLLFCALGDYIEDNVGCYVDGHSQDDRLKIAILLQRHRSRILFAVQLKQQPNTCGWQGHQPNHQLNLRGLFVWQLLSLSLDLWIKLYFSASNEGQYKLCGNGLFIHFRDNVVEFLSIPAVSNVFKSVHHHCWHVANYGWAMAILV